MMGVMTADKACQLPIDQLAEELWAEIPTGTTVERPIRNSRGFSYAIFHLYIFRSTSLRSGASGGGPEVEIIRLQRFHR